LTASASAAWVYNIPEGTAASAQSRTMPHPTQPHIPIVTGADYVDLGAACGQVSKSVLGEPLTGGSVVPPPTDMMWAP
jgi:hypothetical protein